MSVEQLISMLLVGAISGWIAGLFWKGGGFGLLGNIVIGVLGAFVGGWLLTKLGVNLGFENPLIGTIVQSVIGALAVLFVAGIFRRVGR